jgi:hypothetical protein
VPPTSPDLVQATSPAAPDVPSYAQRLVASRIVGATE